MAQGVGSRVATQGIPGGSGQVDRRCFYFHVCAACCSCSCDKLSTSPSPGRQVAACGLGGRDKRLRMLWFMLHPSLQSIKNSDYWRLLPPPDTRCRSLLGGCSLHRYRSWITWTACTERALVVFLPRWPSCPAQHASCISQACWCARRLAGVGCVSCSSMSIRRWSLVVR